MFKYFTIPRESEVAQVTEDIKPAMKFSFIHPFFDRKPEPEFEPAPHAHEPANDLHFLLNDLLLGGDSNPFCSGLESMLHDKPRTQARIQARTRSGIQAQARTQPAQARTQPAQARTQPAQARTQPAQDAQPAQLLITPELTRYIDSRIKQFINPMEDKLTLSRSYDRQIDRMKMETSINTLSNKINEFEKQINDMKSTIQKYENRTVQEEKETPLDFMKSKTAIDVLANVISYLDANTKKDQVTLSGEDFSQLLVNLHAVMCYLRLQENVVTPFSHNLRNMVSQFNTTEPSSIESRLMSQNMASLGAESKATGCDCGGVKCEESSTDTESTHSVDVF